MHRGHGEADSMDTKASAQNDSGCAAQAWGWLEASGLEANSTCMNAVVGALARGNAWHPPRGTLPTGGPGFGGAFVGGGGSSGDGAFGNGAASCCGAG